ncbi:hypothetical protein LLH00_08110 [bacterium]|nr:hypothetical protein [bacterium]
MASVLLAGFLAGLAFLTAGCGAGSTQNSPTVTAKRDTWVRAALAEVETTLAANPPGSGEPELRRQTLWLLDDPLHLSEAPRIGAIGEYYRQAIESALTRIEDEKVTSGATLWKLYNHSFVVKTSEATFGFDINPGVDSVLMSDSQQERLARALDVMFLSHPHRDHANYGFVERLRRLGKPVAAPEGLWSDRPLGPGLTYPSAGADLSLGGVAYRVFPGHQEDIPNNVHLVRSGGVSVMHTGDQDNREDFAAWIDSLGTHHQVDILLPNCWTPDLPRLVRGVNPRLVITGHENELGHTVDHRESFSKTYGKIGDIACPCPVLSWGERYHFESGK